MASDEALPHGRSSCRTPRAFQDIPTSDHRSFFGSKSSKKHQQKTAGDRRVWFSPVHSPLLSPAREKTLQSVKKKVHQSSIFSLHGRGKASIEAEEPTSPKVSCIGQVRAHRKDKDPFEDALRKKSSQSKPGSMSPARFFTSPGRSSKWGSLFGSRKESCATQISSRNGEGQVSCFGLPFETRSAFQTDKTCAFLARSLDLYQEGRSSDNSNKNKVMYSSNKVMYSSTSASDDRFDKQGVCATAAANVYSDDCDSHSFASTSLSHSSPSKEGACEMPGTAMAIDCDNSQPCQHASFENSADDNCHRGKPPAPKQRLTYEELPSLHCNAFTKQKMKVSVEVVPETWLWRNGERLRPDCTSHLSCIPDRSVSTSREDLEKNQQCELNMPVSPCGGTQSHTREGEECVDNYNLPGQSHMTGCGNDCRTNEPIVEARRMSVDDNLYQPCECGIDSKDEKRIDAEHSLANQTSQSYGVASPVYTHIPAVKEQSKDYRRSAGFQGGAHGVQSSAGADATRIGKQQVQFRKLNSEAEMEKSRCMVGSFEAKPGHETLRRIGVDVGKENYSIAFPQLMEKSLSSLHSKDDGKQFRSILKGSRKNEAFSAQPFGALIVVGYDQSAASKDAGCKDEELLKGILEVGRLSFQGSGKYFQVLNSDAAFNRSRSVTFHRTVIRLQRCNSDPCRPSC